MVPPPCLLCFVKKNASEFLLKRFLFKSATTYFHAPFPANYLRHK